MKTLLLLILLVSTPAFADQQVIRDKTGRIIGTIDSGANGGGTVRDRTQRPRFSYERQADGTIVIRDRTGRIVQTITPTK